MPAEHTEQLWVRVRAGVEPGSLDEAKAEGGLGTGRWLGIQHTGRETWATSH